MQLCGNQSATKQSNSRGFSVVELVVVMGIIAVLAGIMLPGIAQVKENARRSVCSSNMRELGLAMAEYSVDNDEREPVADDWANGIFAYAETPQIYRCPSYSGTKKITYSMNSLLDSFEVSDIRSISSVVGLYESTAPPGADPDPAKAGDDAPRGTYVGYDDVSQVAGDGGQLVPGSLYRHAVGGANGKAAGSPSLNYLLTDGHIRFVAHNQVEDATIANNGLTASAVAMGAYKPGSVVTFNPLASQ
jgi:prepilin-type N-terminal cleavage/methylation domain-containing protein